MARQMLFPVLLVVLLGFNITEGCKPRPRPPPPPPPPTAAPEPAAAAPPPENNAGETRFLTNLSPQMMYLGSADEKAFYAAVSTPMNCEAATDYCKSANMELASSTLTENQNELLGNAVTEVAYAFGLDSAETPIRYWTSSFESEKYDEEIIALQNDECETASVSGYEISTDSTKCTDVVEVTICEVDD